MDKITQKTDEQREIRKAALSLIIKKRQFKEYESEFKEEAKRVNSMLKAFLEKRGMKKALIETSDKKVSICIVEPKKIVWDIDKLNEKLDKDTADEVFNKIFTITNYKAIVELLKKHNVPAKEFTKHIKVERELNEDILDNLFEMGWLSKEDVEGCYQLIDSTPFVKMTATDKKE